MDTDLKLIEQEDWQKARGVRTRGQTNAALAPRDYFVKCELNYKIIQLKGYWVWWCTPHHQPSFLCNTALAKLEIKEALSDLQRKIQV